MAPRSLILAAAIAAAVVSAAAQDDGSLQAELGWKYETAKDYGLAAKMYREAAGLGNADGENGLGWLYQNGLGVDQDAAQAAVWYRKAAEQGSAEGQAHLAWLYETGTGVAQDFAEAMKWYGKAAALGNGDAQNSLGWMYQNGEGVARDYVEAAKWYGAAAAGGNARAQANYDNLKLLSRAPPDAGAPAPQEERPSARLINPLPARSETPMSDDRPVSGSHRWEWPILTLAAGVLIALTRLLKIPREEPANPLSPVQSAGTSAAAVEDSFIGGVIGAKYEIRRRIGEGGMGVVFEGYDRKLMRSVAIKKMRPELRASPEERKRFIHEAQIISHLTHPYIVGVHEIVEDRGDIFLVFDYVDGRPLSEVIGDSGRLTFTQSWSIMGYVCEAVHCAHSSRVLHRDLKPSNIMIDKNGFAKVMDFGLAREAKERLSKLTQKDTSGTPAYMAPEQHLGRAVRASDVYALGVCLYEMLTGTLPFAGPDFLAQKERRKYTPPQFLVPELPKSIELFMATVLEPDPKKRIGTAPEFLEALKSI